MRFRKAERMAAMAVLAAAAAVAGAGVKLAKRHTEYLMKKTAAKFKDDDNGADTGGPEKSEPDASEAGSGEV